MDSDLFWGIFLNIINKLQLSNIFYSKNEILLTYPTLKVHKNETVLIFLP
jgi:hypothetical protein